MDEVTITLNISVFDEARLQTRSEKSGLSVEEVLAKIVSDFLTEGD